MVSLPVSDSIDEFVGFFTFPDWSQLGNPEIYVTAVTIAIIASLETLLSLDAVDKLDPYKRIAPANRELTAQGIGNMISGLIGGTANYCRDCAKYCPILVLEVRPRCLRYFTDFYWPFQLYSSRMY